MGTWHLDQWSANAGQIQKNAVYAALFAVVDGSAFRRYEILDDAERGREFFLVVRENLVIKASVANFDAFGLLYIGPPEAAPGLAHSNRWRAPTTPSSESRSEIDPDQRSLET
jgi:Family of unknown function (DUF6235)